MIIFNFDSYVLQNNPELTTSCLSLTLMLHFTGSLPSTSLHCVSGVFRSLAKGVCNSCATNLKRIIY